MTLPGAASMSLATVLGGPVRTVTVTAALPRALYLTTGHQDTPALCLAAADAVRVPCALVLGPGTPVPEVAVGSAARIGEGTVEVGGSTVTATRWWRPSRPQVPPGHDRTTRIDAVRRAVGAAGAPHGALPGPDTDGTGFDAAADRFAAALGAVTGIVPDELRAAVRSLLGRGEGLTPLGDDILAGALVTLVGANHAAGPLLGSIVTQELATRPGATTPVSAALLVHAARGECVPELAAVLTHPVDRLGSAVGALLGVGHSSGGGLLRGVEEGLNVLTAPMHAKGQAE